MTKSMKTGRRLTALLQASVFVLSMVCASLAFKDEAHAAQRTIGQIALATGIYSDGGSIPFGKTFTAPPVVVVNACDAAGNPLAAAAAIVSTTGFTVAIWDLNGFPASNATVQWIAIIPDPNAKVQAGCVHGEIDGDAVSFNRAFDIQDPIVLCSAYNSTDHWPDLASYQRLTSSGFDVILKDMYGNPEMADLSWIAFDPSVYLYDEAVLLGYLQMYNDNAHIGYGTFQYYADNVDVALTCGQKNGNAYCSAAHNISLIGFDLSLRDYYNAAGSTSVWTSWALFHLNPPGTHIVTFDKNGGDLNPGVKLTDASGHVALPTLTIARTGYTFAGWNTQADGLGAAFTASTTVTEDITVYAAWIDNSAYAVTFNKNGGDTDASPVIKYVAPPATMVGSLPAPPSRSGYYFAGWNTQSDGLGIAFTASTAVTGNITVHAVWTPIYTVTFDKNGGDTEASPKTAATDLSGHAAPPAANPTRAGYTFAGWNTQSNGLGSAFTASTAVTGNITVYAVWTPIYTVTFDKNGGDTDASPKTGTTDVNRRATLPVTNPTRAGYYFTGWNTQSDGLGSTFTASTAVTGNMTVYAVWTPIPPTPPTPIYAVTFDKNGGDTDASPGLAYTDASGHVALPSPPIRAGYEFKAWNTMPDGSGALFSSSTVVSSDMTVYAQWNKVKPVYTVKFVTSGGTPVPDITAEEGAVINAPSTARAGYDFDGWYMDAGLSRPAAFPFTVTGNATFYADWTRIYTADELPATVWAGTELSVAPASPPEGYTLKTIACSTSDARIAAVTKDGDIAFLKGGKVTLIVKMVFTKPGVTRTVTVVKTITVKQLVSSITLNKTSASLKPKQTLRLIAVVNPSSATNKGVSWKSSNSSVATVSAAGVVTAGKKGTAIITCTARDGSGVTVVCIVEVK